MKTIKICILILNTIIVLFNQCNAMEMEFKLNGHQSGIYIEHRGSSKGRYSNGIVPLFQTIADDIAIYGLFQFQHKSFAADTTKKMLEDAAKEKLSQSNGAKVNWKSFLEEVMVNVEAALMKNDLSKAEKESKTQAVVVIVDGNTVTQARVGNGRISLLVSDPNLRSQKIRHIDEFGENVFGTLGGQCEKQLDRFRFPNKIAEVKKLVGNIQYIVIGTEYSWSSNCHDIINMIYNDQNDLIGAAKDITHSFETPSTEKDIGVIVIGMGQPKIQRQKSLMRSLSCCKNPAVEH